MKRNLLLMLTLLLATCLLAPGSLLAQINIMFITNGDSSPAAGGEDDRDSLAVAMLIEYGYTVTIITDDQTKEQDPAVAEAIEACDGIVISGTVGSGDVLADTTIIPSDKPILSWEYAVWDDMGLVAGTDAFPWQDTLLYLEDGVDPYLIGSHSGGVQFLTTIAHPDPEYTAPEFRATEPVYAPGAHAVGTLIQGDSTQIPYLYADVEDVLIDSVTTATKRLIAFGMFNNDMLPLVTDYGWELFLRAVVWMVDDAFVGTSPLLISRKNVSWYANGSLYVDLNGINKITSVKVFDISGKLVLQEQVTGGSSVIIPVSNLNNGIYIVTGEDFAEKFIKN